MVTTPGQPLTPQENELMRAWARALVAMPRAFEADLGRETGLSFSEYSAMRNLVDTPHGALRMGDLATLTALTLGAVTRVVKALEAKGLVERRRCPDDGRGYEAVLTDAGRARILDATPAFVTSVRARVLDHIAPEHHQFVTAMLDAISGAAAAKER